VQDFDLCLECFAEGVEVYPHRQTHSYRIIDHITTPLFDEDWGADEELLLLEAIELYGLGNWSDVADHVGTKNKTKCEAHYYEIFLNSQTAPLPVCSRPLPVSARARIACHSIGLTPSPSPLLFSFFVCKCRT
jgi:transcriptional adapter 2-alpha